MTMQQWWAIPTTLAALFPLACGGSDGPADKGPQYAYPDLSSFCEARSKAECTEVIVAECGSTDTEDCLSVRRRICNQSAPSSATYYPAAAETCLEAVTAAHKDNKYTAEEDQEIAKECALIWGGSGVEGAPCEADYYCKLDEGLRCVKGPDQLSGKCYVPEEKETGDSCERPQSVCTKGTYCTQNDKICANKREIGTSCSPTEPCGEGLRCVGGDNTSLCESKLDRGEICSENEACVSAMCAKVGDNKKCVDSQTFSANEPICSNYRQ